jgi:hypothetical protein
MRMLSSTFLLYVTAWWSFLDSEMEIFEPVLSLISFHVIIDMKGQSFVIRAPASRRCQAVARQHKKITSSLSLLLPMDAFNRAGLDGLLNLVFRGALLVNDLCLSRVFVEFKDLRTDLLAGTASDALLFINEDLSRHKKTSFAGVSD